MTESIFRRKQSTFFKRNILPFTRAIRFIPSVLMVIGFSCVTNLAQAEVTYYINDYENLSETPYSTPNSQIIVDLYGYEADSQWDVVLTEKDNNEGDIYGFSIWAYAFESSFRVEIILKKAEGNQEIVLATWENQTTTDSGYYQLVEGETTGIDSDATSGDQLILRITKTSQEYYNDDDVVSIMTGDGCPSKITIKSKDSGDGGGGGGCFIASLLK